MSRKTIGEDMLNQLDESPIDLLTTPAIRNGTLVKAPKVEAFKAEKAKKAKDEAQQGDAQESGRQIKERMTVQISKATIERVKDCVYWNRSTVAQFVEEALEAALKYAEKENGKPFVKRKAELKPGRPLK